MGGFQNYFSIISIMFPLGVVLVFWSKFDKIWTAIEKLTTKEYADETFQRQDVAEKEYIALKESIDEMKKDITEIRNDIKTLLSRNQCE